MSSACTAAHCGHMTSSHGHCDVVSCDNYRSNCPVHGPLGVNQ